jgi:hypothetical protein
MKIYQTVEAVPSRVLGLLRVLRQSGKDGLTRATVIDLLQPKSLRIKDTADTLATNTIAAVMELSADDTKLIEEKEDETGERRLYLVPFLLDCPDNLFDTHARSSLERAALRPKVGDSPNGFSRVCAWLLCQSPSDMPQGHAELKTRMHADGMDYEQLGLNNDARWDVVVYWANYFGLLWQWQDEKCKGIVPDPSAYLLRHLDELLPLNGQVSISQFKATLGQLCPILDGGVTHELVADKLSKKGIFPQKHREHVSPALSFALRNLKDDGALRYWCPDDQRTFYLMSFDEKIAFLERGGKK